MRHIMSLMFMLFATGSAVAQDGQRDVMVVFDMSGSMWGQVDGVAKVDIARDAFGRLIEDWNDNGTRAGLIAYGHRRKGDCGDIELLAQPGEKMNISTLVAGLQPQGKTPLSDAVRQAAEVLKLTENAATVVLLSDGVETCDADPCAVGAELEALGLDFTAHVIGFDIAEGDKAQLQCLASATGGQYFDAADARGLADAMDGVARVTVVNAPAPKPENVARIQPVIIRIGMPNGLRLPAETIIFLGENEIGRLSDADAVVPGLAVDLPIGSVTLRAQGDNASGTFTFDISAQTEILKLELTPAPDDYGVLRGTPLPIARDHIVLIKNTTGIDRDVHSRVYLIPMGSTDPDARLGGQSMSPTAGIFNPAYIPSPATPGEYEILVMDGRNTVEYARFPVRFDATVTPQWRGAREVGVGGMLDAKWVGDANRSTSFRFSKEDGSTISQISVERLATKVGFKIPAPDEPGIYDLSFKYQDVDNTTIVVSFGQIAVGVLYEQGVTIEQIKVDTDPIIGTLEGAAGIGDNAELLPFMGDLNGDWKLITIRNDQTVELLKSRVIHSAGDAIGGGGLFVEARPNWGFGDRNSFGEMILATNGANTLLMTLTTETGTFVTELAQADIGWAGSIVMANGDNHDVILARPHDLAKSQVADFPNGIDHQLTAVDERGERITTAVTWTMQSIDMDGPDIFQSEGDSAYDSGRAPGSYLVTATTRGGSGKASFTMGRQERRANFVVIKPLGEGDALAIETAFFCANGEDCRMTERQVPYDFTLPEGWGAERLIARRDGGPRVNMSTHTPNGPFYATLNQPYGFDTCIDVLAGRLCHDATNDRALMADIAALRQTFSFQPTGQRIPAGDLKNIIRKLTGDAK